MDGYQPWYKKRRTLVGFSFGLLVLALAGWNLSGCNSFGTGTAPAAASDFLDASDFAGSYENAEGDVILGGQSTYNGRLVFTNLSRTVVEGVLGENLRLAENISNSKDRHPVVLMFGHQTDTAWVSPVGGVWPIGEDYQELIVMIPFVQIGDNLEWHNYVVRMYLDDVWAVFGGNLWFGYRKVLAQLTETVARDSLDVNVFSNDVFVANLSDFGPWLTDDDAEDTLRNYRQVKEILGMPVLGTNTTVGNVYVCSYFELSFGSAQVRTFTSRHAFQPGFVGIDDWVALGEVTNVADGAFDVEGLIWRLGFPDACAN